MVPTETCAGFNNRSRTLICLVQKQVSATIDGRYGRNTCRAFRSSVYGKSGLLNDPSLAEIVKSAGLPVNPSDETISQAFTKEEQASCDKNGPLIKGMPAAASTQTPAVATKSVEEAKGARTAIERSASAAQIGDWRELLSLPKTPPAFDDAFRDALSKFQAAQNLPEKKGELDAATATALEKKGPGKK